MRPSLHATFCVVLAFAGFVLGGLATMGILASGVVPIDDDFRLLSAAGFAAALAFLVPAPAGFLGLGWIARELVPARCTRCARRSRPRTIHGQTVYECTQCRHLDVTVWQDDTGLTLREEGVIERHNRSVARGEDPGDLDQALVDAPSVSEMLADLLPGSEDLPTTKEILTTPRLWKDHKLIVFLFVVICVVPPVVIATGIVVGLLQLLGIVD